MKTGRLRLYCGEFAIVDSEDVEYLSKFRWHKAKFKHTNYVRGTVEGKQILLHRLIMKEPVGMDVDHINHNGMDNRKENLRIVTRSQNAQNSRVGVNNTSGVKNVHYIKSRNRYRVVIGVDNKNIQIGYFKTLEEATEARTAAVKKYHGEYACF